MAEPETIIISMTDVIPTAFLRTIVEMVAEHRDEIEAGMEKEATP